MEMRMLTDKELTLACTLVGEITDYWRNHEMAPPHEPLLQLRKPAHIFPAIPPSLIELARFGWTLLTASHWKEGGVSISSENDYEGIILFHREKRLILLCHRGMQLNSPANIANCLRIGKGNIPKIVDDSINMCELAVRLLAKEQYNDCEIYHTGFSMGGFLSQITASYCNHHYQSHNRATCYDAPGAKLAIEALGYSNNQKNIVIYLTSPNVVNTATPHYGYVRQVTHFSERNDYKDGRLRDVAVAKALAINVSQLITQENIILAGITADTHLGLFNSPFNDNNNFDFLHVHSWPLACNTFISRYPSTDSLKPPTFDPSDSFGKVLMTITQDVGNKYLETQVDQITWIAGVEDISSIQHQVPNPNIQHHHEAILIQTQNSEVVTSLVDLIKLVMLLTIRELNKLSNQRAEQAQEGNERVEGILSAMNNPQMSFPPPISQPNTAIPTITSSTSPLLNNQNTTTSTFSKTPGFG